MPGDKLRVRPGDNVPVDGVVVEGGSAVDESLLTGEPIPVDKAAGANVTGGTRNTTGTFVMEASRVGAATPSCRRSSKWSARPSAAARPFSVWPTVIAS